MNNTPTVGERKL